ncbi:MAG: hypothetical protein FJ146_04095 [Deltaproteobacteria bacterium]|nr:hypothetical protein [Deltaproteobacteria bacterium]
MHCRTITKLIIAAFSMNLWAADALAYDYHGYLLGGGYIAREQFTAETAGLTNNDRAVVSSRLTLDVTKISSQQYQLFIDIRDQHDFFDKVDAERLELRGRNSLRLRQLNLSDPGHSHKYFWTIGRFLPGANNVVFNDGIESGLRLNPNHRVGVFAGYKPRITDEPVADIGSDLYQIGGYHIYELEGESWDEGKYIANFLISGPEFANDQGTVTNTWINQSLLHFGPRHRAGSYLNVSGQDSPQLEEGRLEWDERFNTKLSARISASHLDLRAYRHQRDILEPLPASPYSQAKGLIQYRMNDQARLEGTLILGRRTIDYLDKQELTLGGTLTRFATEHAQISGYIGTRRGFISRDLFMNSVFNYFATRWMSDVSLRLTRQNRYNGIVLNQLIISSNLGFYLSKRILVSAGGELAADENNRIASGLLTIGYRFGTREFTPLRDVAPPNARY